MEKRYKVVKKKNRGSIYAKGKYHRTYNKGDTVKAPAGTYGLMCFKDREDAEEFAAAGEEIITIRPLLEKEMIPTEVSVISNEAGMDRFYHNRKNLDPSLITNIPFRTVCYKKIKVLD